MKLLNQHVHNIRKIFPAKEKINPALLSFCIYLLPVQDTYAVSPDINARFGEIIILDDKRCVVNMSSYYIDFGLLTRWQLEDTGSSGMRSPGEKTVIMSVSCHPRRPFHFSLKGDALHDGSIRYGRTGMLQLRLHDAVLDGNQVKLSPFMRGEKHLGEAYESVLLKAGSGVTAVNDNGKIAIGRTFTAHLQVRPLIPYRDTIVTELEVSESNFNIVLSGMRPGGDS